MTATQERDDLREENARLKEQIRTGYAPTDGPPPEPTMAVTEVRNDLRQEAHDAHERFQMGEHLQAVGVDVEDPEYPNQVPAVDIHPDPEEAARVLRDNEKFRDQAVYDQVVQTNRDFPHAAALAVQRDGAMDPDDYEKLHKLQADATAEEAKADDKAAKEAAKAGS